MSVSSQMHVVERLAHFLIREFEDAERAAAHHLKAGQDVSAAAPSSDR